MRNDETTGDVERLREGMGVNVAVPVVRLQLPDDAGQRDSPEDQERAGHFCFRRGNLESRLSCPFE